MKIYALFTLHETGWGTRAGVGDRERVYPEVSSLILTVNVAATATAAQEKEAQQLHNGNYTDHNAYDVEMNGVNRKA
jgi:hypothetical protein